MKKRLLRLTAALLFCAGTYGVFAIQTAYALCGCSCTVVCPNTCSFSCDGCTISEAYLAIKQCCEKEAKNVTPYCSN